VRRNHAKELLGKYYRKSVVRQGEKVPEMNSFIYEWTSRALETRWQKYSNSITKTIMVESKKYGFDPVFLMAVIQNESSFNPEIIGSFGEIGLMQITPETGKWMAHKYNIPWHGAKSLKDPVVNITLGSAYLSYLREKFDFRSQLYLAAYNMGSRNVQRALARQVWPKQYPSRVMQRYVGFYTKLSEETHHAMN
jgi:soluble lytic murein transglycosylase